VWHAGIRTPLPIKEMQKTFPKIYQELLDNTTNLEKHLCDMQDCEFTLQDGVLYMLQTRNGKRTGPAALRVATDMEVRLQMYYVGLHCLVLQQHDEWHFNDDATSNSYDSCQHTLETAQQAVVVLHDACTQGVTPMW
jgi:phosphoenolpyruvate synthase/pyruvate phosphate dikinase